MGKRKIGGATKKLSIETTLLWDLSENHFFDSMGNRAPIT